MNGEMKPDFRKFMRLLGGLDENFVNRVRCRVSLSNRLDIVSQNSLGNCKLPLFKKKISIYVILYL